MGYENETMTSSDGILHEQNIYDWVIDLRNISFHCLCGSKPMMEVLANGISPITPITQSCCFGLNRVWLSKIGYQQQGHIILHVVSSIKVLFPFITILDKVLLF